MIVVRVGQDHSIQRFRAELRWNHILPISSGESLEDAKIDEHTSLAGFDEIRRSCNAAGGSEEGESDGHGRVVIDALAETQRLTPCSPPKLEAHGSEGRQADA